MGIGRVSEVARRWKGPIEVNLELGEPPRKVGRYI